MEILAGTIHAAEVLGEEAAIALDSLDAAR